MGGRGGHPEVPEAATAAANCQSPPESGLSTELGGAGTGSDLQVSARGRGGPVCWTPGTLGALQNAEGTENDQAGCVCVPVGEAARGDSALKGLAALEGHIFNTLWTQQKRGS